MLNLATRIIERSGVAGLVEEYRAEHARKVGAGGRPLLIPIQSALILMWLPSLEKDRTCQVTTVGEFIEHRITAEQRERLGLPRWTPFEESRHWIARMHSSLDAFFRLIGPYWMPDRRKQISKVEFDEIKAARGEDFIEERMDRLYTVMNALVRATVAEAPWQYRANFKGDRAVDGTSFKVTAKGTGFRNERVSVEPNA